MTLYAHNSIGRWYMASNGNWLNADPTGLAAGPNPYDYVGTNPTDAIDAAGLVSVFMRGWNGGSSGKHSAGSLQASGFRAGGSSDSSHRSAATPTAEGAQDDYSLYDWVNKKFDYYQVDDAVKYIIETVGEPDSQKQPIIIIGHSLGGDAAITVANKLKNRGYQVYLLATLDPITGPVRNIAGTSVPDKVVVGALTTGTSWLPDRIRIGASMLGLTTYVAGYRIPMDKVLDNIVEREKPSNVKKALNWYQTVDARGRGSIVEGADENIRNPEASEENKDKEIVKGKVLLHTEIDDDPSISQRIKKEAQQLADQWEK